MSGSMPEKSATVPTNNSPSNSIKKKKLLIRRRIALMKSQFSLIFFFFKERNNFLVGFDLISSPPQIHYGTYRQGRPCCYVMDRKD